jgi:nucleoside-diphosphate-sugar epimerase
MNILVAGGAGYIGSHMVAVLATPYQLDLTIRPKTTYTLAGGRHYQDDDHQSNHLRTANV